MKLSSVSFVINFALDNEAAKSKRLENEFAEVPELFFQEGKAGHMKPRGERQRRRREADNGELKVNAAK